MNSSEDKMFFVILQKSCLEIWQNVTHGIKYTPVPPPSVCRRLTNTIYHLFNDRFAEAQLKLIRMYLNNCIPHISTDIIMYPCTGLKKDYNPSIQC